MSLLVKVFCELFDLKNLSVATITTVLRNYLATYATERHIFLYHCAEKYDCIILNCETVMIASSLIIKLCSNKKLRDQNLDQSKLKRHYYGPARAGPLYEIRI